MIPTKWKSHCSTFLELIYPPSCAGCGEELSSTEIPLCENCLHHIRLFQEPLCPTCGAPLSAPLNKNEKRCKLCLPGKHYFNQIRSLYSYKDKRIKGIVHALKFEYQVRIAETMSHLMLNGLMKFYPDEHFDFLIPIPLHKSRLKQREFNQSELISHSISEKLQIPIRKDLLARTRKTPPQTTLNPQKRLKNLVNAFSPLNHEKIKGSSILLIDDVVTTGATINAASFPLRQCGAKIIKGLTFAQTIDFPGTYKNKP